MVDLGNEQNHISNKIPSDHLYQLLIHRQQFENQTRMDLKDPSEGLKMANYLQALNKAAQDDWSVTLDGQLLPNVYFHFSDSQTVDQICIGFPPYVKSGFPTQTYYGEAVCGQRDNNSSDK